jgi:hypothetical protein
MKPFCESSDTRMGRHITGGNGGADLPVGRGGTSAKYEKKSKYHLISSAAALTGFFRVAWAKPSMANRQVCPTIPCQ